MANREKIIILVMIIVVAYGGYSYFTDSGGSTIMESSKQNIGELKKFVVDAATSLSNDYISSADKYIIDQAEKVLPQNPFLGASLRL